MHACLQVYFISLSLHECQGIRWLLIYLGLQAFLALTHSARLVPHHRQRESVQEVPMKRGKKYFGDREKSFYILCYISLQRFQNFGRGKCFYFFFITFFLRIVLFISGCLFQGSHCCFLEQSHCQWKSVICTVLLFL